MEYWRSKERIERNTFITPEKCRDGNPEPPDHFMAPKKDSNIKMDHELAMYMSSIKGIKKFDLFEARN